MEKWLFGWNVSNPLYFDLIYLTPVLAFCNVGNFHGLKADALQQHSTEWLCAFGAPKHPSALGVPTPLYMESIKVQPRCSLCSLVFLLKDQNWCHLAFLWAHLGVCCHLHMSEGGWCCHPDSLGLRVGYTPACPALLMWCSSPRGVRRETAQRTGWEEKKPFLPPEGTWNEHTLQQSCCLHHVCHCHTSEKSSGGSQLKTH